MIAGGERFRELAIALRWQSSRLVAMLWAYFDESGLHYPQTGPKKGSIEWLVLGGGMTTVENWGLLSTEWKEALHVSGVKVFHMTDLEKRKGEFEGWGDEDHDVFLNRLLDIQARYVPEIFGVTNHAARHRGRFRKLYGKNIADVIKMAAQNVAPNQEEPLSIMFAVHDEFDSSNVVKCFMDLVGRNPRFAECVVGKPPDHPPLQVADMIAYELSHSIIDGVSAPPRNSYVHMKERAKNLTLWLLIQ
jgi:Protein of unknown function (DUF3800)